MMSGGQDQEHPGADGDSNNGSINSLRTKRNKSLFGDCALVEIIHLHDCLRGAITALQRDVEQLCMLSTSNVCAVGSSSSDTNSETEKHQRELSEVERRLVGRFKVIWSVFRAHSAAEDEFIWPALKAKLIEKTNNATTSTTSSSSNIALLNKPPNIIVQQEYEEDHADEEKMFLEMDEMLSKIRSELFGNKQQTSCSTAPMAAGCVSEMTATLQSMVLHLSNHLFKHLEKEEVQCLPLVAKHMNKEEINELVGKIMGRRSSDMMGKILTMAVQTLPKSEREEMIENMKQAMVGTFFERWLVMEGFGGGSNTPTAATTSTSNKCNTSPPGTTEAEDKIACAADSHCCLTSTVCIAAGKCVFNMSSETTLQQEDLTKLIKTIAANPSMTLEEKNSSIQLLRDSVWKNNRKRKFSLDQTLSSSSLTWQYQITSSQAQPQQASASTKDRRVTPPSAYYRKTNNNKVELVWSSESSTCFQLDGTVPRFSASELAPTYHDGAAGAVLGCPHYARAVKKRHPESGRLYTCRLCCEQDRERPLKDHDSPLDRYKVTEVLCMRCGALQPADKRCVNPKCESKGKPFARYYCKICNLYDDNPKKKIYHCPFCNVCRSGAGLGIDFRHCMRCNACVSLSSSSTSSSNNENHVCIPHCLQGNCPICHESMFESTKPLRGLKCGHVMHLPCFTLYIRGQTYTCPLCKKSVEDMREYFSQLDAAIWMQPMPAAYSTTMSKIYCQDCSKYCTVQYHFVGCKCIHCGSYNTREVERIAGHSS
mmetsp:Transcript_2117/g.3255  ORF Transcript_2117/g.3255 Transcript_2117/m.3255 type:complete len:767 (+) Transcript_2117:61-2361(+)